MGYIREYKNGLFSTALIETSVFAESLNMIGIVAGPSAMRVLNSKSYSSSPRSCSNLKSEQPANLDVLNLTRKSDMLFYLQDNLQ